MVINRMKALVFYFVIRLYGYKFLDLWEIIHVYYTFYYHWHIDCVWLSLVHLQVNFGTCICIPCNIHVQMYMKVGWESIYTVTPHIYANLYKSWISQFLFLFQKQQCLNWCGHCCKSYQGTSICIAVYYNYLMKIWQGYDVEL